MCVCVCVCVCPPDHVIPTFPFVHEELASACSCRRGLIGNLLQYVYSRENGQTRWTATPPQEGDGDLYLFYERLTHHLPTWSSKTATVKKRGLRLPAEAARQMGCQCLSSCFFSRPSSIAMLPYLQVGTQTAHFGTSRCLPSIPSGLVGNKSKTASSTPRRAYLHTSSPLRQLLFLFVRPKHAHSRPLVSRLIGSP